MNYGEKNIKARRKEISSKKKRKKKKVGVTFFKLFLIFVLSIGIIGVVGAGIFIKKTIDKTPVIKESDVKPSGTTTFVVDEEGNTIDSFFQKGSNRIYKTYDEIPKDLAHAFVAIEDERFYDHNGIDIMGILRAGVKGILSGHLSEGASTLTQQLIKNNVFPNFTEEKTFSDRLQRKLQEQYLAIQVEKQMSKKEILEAYMNTINLGQGCLGIQTASKRYFGKDVSELTLSECAVIAGITQSPTQFDPILHPEANAKRREHVLQKMLEQDYISQKQYEEAKADAVYDRIKETADAEPEESVNSYFVDALFQDVIDDLISRKNFSETQAYNLVYSGGLTIVATQDRNIQNICDTVLADPSNYPAHVEYGLEYALTVTHADGTSDNYSKEMLKSYLQETYGEKYPLDFSSPEEAQAAVDEYKSTLGITDTDTVFENMNLSPQPQISMVLMDQHTGYVKAIVGGRGDKKVNLSLNRAVDSYRQPGSCFKPLAVYSPALDSAGYTLATPIVDEPYKYANGSDVPNWSGTYIGTTNIRHAIEQSMNVVAVKTLTDIGIDTGFDMLKNYGFTSLVSREEASEYDGNDDLQQPLALGGITRGVCNLELSAAYATIANGGVYTKPILYTKILDHEGNVLLDNTTPLTHRVIKDSTAALLTSCLQDVVTIGTGTTANFSNMAVAGKTGTTGTSDLRNDLWFCGFTPYYTCAMWSGFDSYKTLNVINDEIYVQRLWRQIMSQVHETLPYKDFEMPESVQKKTICTKTGLLATSSCPATSEYFASGTAPSQSCPGHVVEKPKEKEKDKDKNKDKDKDKDKEEPDDSKEEEDQQGETPDPSTPNSGDSTTPAPPDSATPPSNSGD